MGIESDKVVYEYLSRVGDVAHQRQLPSATRMRLVSQLRDEIGRRRAGAVVDSPAAVRRILSRLGSPDDVVDAAGSGGSGTVGTAAAAAVPVPREDGPGAKGKGLRRVVPRPRPAERRTPPPPAADAPAPPHRAGEDELGDGADQPDWWRVDSGPFGVGDSVPGFTGGVEIPELFRPPEKDQDTAPEPEPEPGPGPAAGEAVAAGVEPDGGGAVARRRFLPSPGRWNNPLLLLAAALLVVGAVLGNLLPLAVGWLIAYASRRLAGWEIKWAVVILPGTAVVAGFVWLWGRLDGRWGAPIADGHMNAALSETWPWVVRGAAVVSALFLVWRSQRKG
ncbi:hypothetical protein ACWCPM_22225 [Streptomyces sp. NPDC002309]